MQHPTGSVINNSCCAAKHYSAMQNFILNSSAFQREQTHESVFKKMHTTSRMF